MKIRSLTKKSEHPTLTEKKSRLYIVAGLAQDTNTSSLVYWFAVNRYGKLAPSFKEPGVTNVTEYRQQHEPAGRGSTEWQAFMKTLPETYQEGDPDYMGGRGSWFLEESNETLVAMTAIPSQIATPSGKLQADKLVITQLIKAIRDIVWEMPIPNMQYLQAPSPIGNDILSELSNKFREVKSNLKKKANPNLVTIPEMTQYCIVATGEIVESEQQAIERIKQINTMTNLAPELQEQPGVSMYARQKNRKIEKKHIDKKYGSRNVAKREYSVMSKNLIRLAAEGISPALYTALKKAVDKDMDFEAAKKYVKDETDLELRKEDYDEMCSSMEKESKLINTLIAVADLLDQGNHADMATTVDKLIQDVSTVRARAQKSLAAKAKEMSGTLYAIATSLEQSAPDQANEARALAHEYELLSEQPSVPISIGL